MDVRTEEMKVTTIKKLTREYIKNKRRKRGRQTNKGGT